MTHAANETGHEKFDPMADMDPEAIEKEREVRLDPENRAENTEVNNSERTFDPETGYFEDQDDASDAEKKFPAPETELG